MRCPRLDDARQNDVEEVNLIVVVGNYGWNAKEGSFYFDPNGEESGFVTAEPVFDPVPENLIEPIAEYDHDDGLAIVGGFVYRGSEVPGLAGRYVTGDFSTSFIEPAGRLFHLDAADVFKEFRIGFDNRALDLFLKGFGQDPDGEVYVCGSTGLGPFGTSRVVLKIVPAGVSENPTDINGDGAVNAQDIQFTVNAVLSIDIGGLNGDVNGDGLINAVDVQTVINRVLGL